MPAARAAQPRDVPGIPHGCPGWVSANVDEGMAVHHTPHLNVYLNLPFFSSAFLQADHNQLLLVICKSADTYWESCCVPYYEQQKNRNPDLSRYIHKYYYLVVTPTA